MGIAQIYKEIGVELKANVSCNSIRYLTFEDLQKLVHSQSNSEQTELLQRLTSKPFWIWNVEQHKQEDIKTK